MGLKDSLLAHSSDPVEMRRLNYQTPGRSFARCWGSGGKGRQGCAQPRGCQVMSGVSLASPTLGRCPELGLSFSASEALGASYNMIM